MLGRRIKEKLANGQTVFGTVFFCTTNPMMVDILPEQGLDFVMVHVEHNTLDLADYMPLRYALATKQIACIARSHSHDLDDITRICDTFPDGVVVPYVEDPDEIRRMVAAAKYRPLKGAARQRLIEHGQWPSAQSRAFIEQRCADTLFLPMIESTDAMENLDEICAIPGIDAVFVGPQDLTVSMGIPDQRDDPRFIEAMGRIIETAERHGIAAGAHLSKIEQVQRVIAQGARFVPFCNDYAFIQRGLTDWLAALGATATASPEKII
jgi:2-keto-3-deoxy-L-rhamnonate aldolase RhmA